MALRAQALWGLSPREYAALRRIHENANQADIAMLAAIRADLHNLWLHQGATIKGHPQPYQPSEFLPDDSGASPVQNGLGSSQSIEERVRVGGRAATQSVEDQKAIFVGMLEAAMGPRQKTYFEHPDGRKITAEEFEDLKNGG